MPNAVYLRKSRAEEQGENTGEVLKKHKAILTELAMKKNLIVTDIYEEVRSGESLAARPQMLELLEAVQNGRYDAVLCMDIDRLGRGAMSDQGLILNAFKWSDTLIITPDKTYDLNNELDEEMTEFKAFFARAEYRMIRKRMRRGLMQTIQAGGYIANPPYGYKKVTINKIPSLEVVEEEARFIRLIFDRYEQGKGSTSIAEELNGLGCTPHRHTKWTRNSVRFILQNPTYMGKVVWNRVRHYKPGVHGKPKHHVEYMPEKDWIIADGVHPSIITQAQWEKVQKIRTNRYIPSQNKGETENPLAGLVVCAVCGKKMQRLGKSTGVPYLLCNTKGCCAGAKFEYVESELIENLSDRLKQLKIEAEGSLPPDTAGEEEQLATAKREDEKLQARLPKLYEFLEDGTYSREVFRERMETAEKEIAALRKKKDELITRIQIKQSALNKHKAAEALDNVLDLYNTYDAAGKNRLLKSILLKIEYTKYKKTKPRDFILTITTSAFIW